MTYTENVSNSIRVALVRQDVMGVITGLRTINGFIDKSGLTAEDLLTVKTATSYLRQLGWGVDLETNTIINYDETLKHLLDTSNIAALKPLLEEIIDEYDVIDNYPGDENLLLTAFSAVTKNGIKT